MTIIRIKSEILSSMTGILHLVILVTSQMNEVQFIFVCKEHEL